MKVQVVRFTFEEPLSKGDEERLISYFQSVRESILRIPISKLQMAKNMLMKTTAFNRPLFILNKLDDNEKVYLFFFADRLLQPNEAPNEDIRQMIERLKSFEDVKLEMLGKFPKFTMEKYQVEN